MKSLAVIPARGGSKRLPRKNVLPFMGKPMLIWTCEAAKNSGMFEKIIISTEDDVIAAVAQEYGFDVLPRSAELASDKATCAQVCLEVIDTLARQGHMYEAFCCLYATAPLRSAADIQGTMALLDDNTDFAFAVTRYDHSPYQALIANASGGLVPAHPLLAPMKSQQLPIPYIGNGSTYAAKVPSFLKFKDFYGPRLRGYVMDRFHSVDIDTQEDLDMALCFAEYLKKSEPTT